MRRETIGAYDKGKAGLVLEEQTLLVDVNSGEVYVKCIGSSFFVGQVVPFRRTNRRVDTVGRKGLRSLSINRLKANDQIRSLNSALVQGKLYCIV